MLYLFSRSSFLQPSVVIHHVLCRRAASRASGYFSLGSIPKDDEPVKLNGALFHSLCTILPFVAASSAEAELGTLFLNMKEARIFRLKLEELVHLPASDTYASHTEVRKYIYR
jgi:hypothetical protein